MKITDLSLDAINNALSFAHETEALEADWERSLVEDEAAEAGAPEVDWTAILAEEAVRQAKWEAETIHEGYSIAVLRVAFDAVKDHSNWKSPVAAAIKARDRDVTRVAVIFYTGSVPTFEPLPNGKLLVSAVGYYVAVGA